MRIGRFVGTTALALLLASAVSAEPPTRTVLVLVAEDACINDQAVIQSLQATLQERWPSRVHFYTEDVGATRFSAQGYQRELPAYLREKHGGRIDLLVVLSRPALDFVLANRTALFANVPTLFAGPGVTADDLTDAGVTGVVVKSEPSRTIGLALQLQPETNQVVLVSGSGDTDRMSEMQAERALQPLAQNVKLAKLTGLPLSELIDRVKKLPPRTVVLYTRVTRDASGAVLATGQVLQAIRHATTVPIYGGARTYLGAGLVGGALVDHAAIGRALGALATQVLAGEPVARIRPVEHHNVVAFDWRELQRLGIAETRLPPGALVEFRQPFLHLSSTHAVYFAIVGAATAVLTLGVSLQRRQRRHLQRVLDERLQFEKNFADASTTFINLTPDEMDSGLRGALHRLLDCAGADRAVIYEPPESPGGAWNARFSEARRGSGAMPVVESWDLDRIPWLASRLRAGQVVTFLDGESREQLGSFAPGTPTPEAAVAVPLAVGPSVLGVIWCMWLHQPLARLDHDLVVERFRVLGQLFASAYRRSQVEATLSESHNLNEAILESLVLHVAVLDRAGVIIAVNREWLEFGRRNGVTREAAIGHGANYLEAAQKGANAGDPAAREALEAVRAVCEGRRDLFTLEYECASPSEARWYLMTVAALRRHEGGAVVTHRDITQAKKIELAIRESEARFRLLADGLPLGVWMSEADGRRTYFNRAWLDLTGHALQRQLGDGWSDALHPDDRQRYLDVYRSAFAEHEAFTIEYRIRRYDGSYGWMADSAVPRYGSDGTFYGYIGGCLDVTNRKETEDALRDLTGRVITAEEEDRRRIARELHDGVNQIVALLAIEIEQLGLTEVGNQAELLSHTHSLWRRTAEISNELHRLSRALHPTRLETFGLIPAVEGFCRDIEQQHGARILFLHSDLPPSVPPASALCIFRIVQEALRNVLKHSGTNQARVDLSGDFERLSLSITDSGRGFDTGDKTSGLGLVSMRERVRYAGGELTIDSRPGEGTRIQVELPLGVAETCGS